MAAFFPLPHFPHFRQMEDSLLTEFYGLRCLFLTIEHFLCDKSKQGEILGSPAWNSRPTHVRVSKVESGRAEMCGESGALRNSPQAP